MFDNKSMLISIETEVNCALIENCVPFAAF